MLATLLSILHNEPGLKIKAWKIGSFVDLGLVISGISEQLTGKRRGAPF